VTSYLGTSPSSSTENALPSDKRRLNRDRIDLVGFNGGTTGVAQWVSRGGTNANASLGDIIGSNHTTFTQNIPWRNVCATDITSDGKYLVWLVNVVVQSVQNQLSASDSGRQATVIDVRDEIACRVLATLGNEPAGATGTTEGFAHKEYIGHDSPLKSSICVLNRYRLSLSVGIAGTTTDSVGRYAQKEGERS